MKSLNLDGSGFVLKRHHMFVPCLLTCQEDYIRITDLVWDPDARRRDAACVFASRFVMQEDWAWGEAVFSASDWLPPWVQKKSRSSKLTKIVKDIMDLPSGSAGSEAKRLAFWDGRSFRRRARCFEILASKSQLQQFLEHFHSSNVKSFGDLFEAFEHAAGVLG